MKKQINKQPHPSQQKQSKLYPNFSKKDKQNRARNDHSIQAKSPLKIPQISLKKADLTFRNKTQQCQLLINQFTPKLTKQANTYLYPKTQKLLTKQSVKLNLQNIKLKSAVNVLQISQLQYDLIDQMWNICNKLVMMQNQYIATYLQNIQSQIRKMIAMFAEQSLQQDAPLASSKKIRLQNCIAHSHCQKQINHKQFQSYLEPSLSLDLEASVKQQYLHHNVSQPLLLIPKTPKNYETTTHQLQMKKIMYMLDGKHKNSNNNILAGNANNVRQTVSDRISSLSSFNQNSNDESGYTVFEISRYSDPQRMSKSSIVSQSSTVRKQQNGQQNLKRQVSGQVQKQNQKQNKRINDSSDMSQSYNSIQNSSSNLKQSMSIGTKRKVLNDIVTMLNIKYNKNIRLE